MVSIANPVKERMQAGGVALGLIVRLARSAEIARIAKATGHDFIFIDAQHALFSRETIGGIVQAALGCGVAPLVRVRSCDDPDIGLLLDNGVAGLVFPDINTPEEARRAVARAKFPPLGRRSVGGGYPQFDFRAVPVGEAVAALDAASLVVCMIESREGLDNVEAIAAVDGVDVLHVGANDLMTALGKPGRFADPECVAAIERVTAAAKAAGKYAGLGGDRDLGRRLRYIRQGVRFVTTQTDLGLLMAGAAAVAAELRGALER